MHSIMGSSFLTFGILLIITANVALSMRFSPETIAACQTESGYTGTMQDIFMSSDATTQGKCFTACLLEKSAVMVGGVIDKTSATAVIENITNGNEERKQRYLSILNQCTAEVPANPDKCEYAFQYLKCKQSKSPMRHG